MRCKKHAADLSSGVGVCASCLRERLLAIMEAQVQKQQLHRKSEAPPPQPPPTLSFPRSVSPYVSRRGTDAGGWHVQRNLYSTPQLGAPAADEVKRRNGRGARFSAMFLGLFRSKSEKLDLNSSSDRGNSGESCSNSPLWFSNLIPGRRRKQIRSFSVDESSIGGAAPRRRRPCRNQDRGMSPARCSDEEDDEQCHGGSSGYSSESSQGWRQTPRRTPATARRRQSKNISGLAFCLSPLVRASPSRQWNQKAMPPEAVLPGESTKPHLSAAASFCKNRSRKLADFGRYNSRH